MRSRRLPVLPAPSDPGARRKLVALITAGPAGRRIARADVRLYRAIRGLARPPRTVAAVRTFSKTGEHAAVWLALGAAGAAADPDRRAQWGRGVRAVVLAYVANTVLKTVFHRRRPAQRGLPALIATPTALSFPSAHATSSFAAARAFQPLVGPVLYPAAAAMSLSRVYLGVHYPTDIAVGALLGTAVGTVAR